MQETTELVSEQEKIAVSDSPDVLKGLQGVALLLEGLPDDAKKIGLTEDRILSAVELSLHRNGVSVFAMNEAIPGQPKLYVNVNVLGSAFSLRLELLENVHLERDSKTCVIGAVTWSKRVLGNAGSGGDYIVKSLEEGVDLFCLDYLKANPK